MSSWPGLQYISYNRCDGIRDCGVSERWKEDEEGSGFGEDSGEMFCQMHYGLSVEVRGCTQATDGDGDGLQKKVCIKFDDIISLELTQE